MNRKFNSFTQCFYWNNKIFCDIRSHNKCSSAVFRHLERPTIVLRVVYCTADDMFFEVSPEISCSRESCR